MGNEEMKKEIVGQKGRWEKYVEKEKTLKKEWELKLQMLEENVVFYRDQEGVLVDEIEKIKEKLAKQKEEEEYHLAKENNMETEIEEYKKNIEKLQRELEELKSNSEILR